MERFRLGFTVRVRVKVVRVSLPFWPPKPRVFPLVVLFWFPAQFALSARIPNTICTCLHLLSICFKNAVSRGG